MFSELLCSYHLQVASRLFNMGTGLLYSFAGSFTIPKLYHNGKALPSSDCLQRNFSKTRVAYHWKYFQVILTAPPSAATLIEPGKLPAYNICLLTSMYVLSLKLETAQCSLQCGYLSITPTWWLNGASVLVTYMCGNYLR